MLNKLKPFFTARFFKFCCVGTSGVFVTEGMLAVFADLIGIHANIASALAIFCAMNTNFWINELWTFSDQRSASVKIVTRWLKYILVSMVGALIQWSVFVACNVAWLMFFGDFATYFQGANSFDLILRPIVDPPDVGSYKYVSQLLGIGVATFWNYLANFYWTWAKGKKDND